jgi:hypothetical protein
LLIEAEFAAAACRGDPQTKDNNAAADEDCFVEGDCESKPVIAAACAAAACTSRAEREAGRGKIPANSGKLRTAQFPLTLNAATSWARAAISAVAKVPSHIRDFFLGSRISDTHLPQVRNRIPR